MSTRPALATHLRRYPWWYGLAAVWLVAMVALPIVKLGPLDALSHQGTDATGTTLVATGPGDLDQPSLDPGGLPPTVGGTTGASATTAPGEAAAGATTSTTKPGTLDLVPPEILDLIFDALPEVVLPPLPDELAPLAAVIAPIAATGCSGLGLASVVVAVVAQSANGVPVQRILPYLSPVSTACASFPIPLHHTVCAADAPLVFSLGGLANTPPILGLGIDEIEATSTLLANTFGQPLPDLAASLRTQLDCKIV